MSRSRPPAHQRSNLSKSMLAKRVAAIFSCCESTRVDQDSGTLASQVGICGAGWPRCCVCLYIAVSLPLTSHLYTSKQTNTTQHNTPRTLPTLPCFFGIRFGLCCLSRARTHTHTCEHTFEHHYFYLIFLFWLLLIHQHLAKNTKQTF